MRDISEKEVCDIINIFNHWHVLSGDVFEVVKKKLNLLGLASRN